MKWRYYKVSEQSETIMSRLLVAFIARNFFAFMIQHFWTYFLKTLNITYKKLNLQSQHITDWQ